MRKVLVFLLILSFCNLCFAGKEHFREIQFNSHKKISLEIRDMDILDVLKMFSKMTGLNIIAGESVEGRVTMFLKDVDVWEALDILLKTNDLAYQVEGNIINVMTRMDYERLYGEEFFDKRKTVVIALSYAKAKEVARILSNVKSNIGKVIADDDSNTLVLIDVPSKIKVMSSIIQQIDRPLQTKIFPLNYATAKEVGEKIQELITYRIGKVKIDERTNKVIVEDFPANIKKIEKVIKELDEKPQQVLIDAQIIEISPSKRFEMGVDWEWWFSKNARFITSLPIADVPTKLSIGVAAKAREIEKEGEYKGIIDLLKTIGETKILSSPRIVVLNKQEAKILIGTREPYTSQTTVTGEGGTVTTSETVNFVDVGIKLFVTPVINKDGFVTMKIRPEVSSVNKIYTTAKGENIPVVATSEAETSVMVKDGVTIIIGGLKKNEKYKTLKKIPVLGELPLIGFPFKSISKETKSSELVILLTPHILSPETPYRESSQINSRREMFSIQKKKLSSLYEDRFSSSEEYYHFISQKIKNKLQELLYSHKVGGEVLISFTLSCNGELIGEPSILKSSCEELSHIAIEALKKSSPFPSFPSDIKKDREVFEIMISIPREKRWL